MKKLINNKRLIEKYLLNECSDEKKKMVDEALKKNQELQAEMEQLKRHNIAFYKQFPAERAVDKIYGRIQTKLSWKRENLRKKQGFFKIFLYASPALLAVIILIVLNNYPFLNNNSNAIVPVEHDREKGLDGYQHLQAYLVVMRERQGTLKFLKNGDSAKAGDILQLAYVSKSDQYGTIVSIDGKGKITLHFPDNEHQSTILKMDERVSLSSAFLLDDAPEFEHFFFITSHQEIVVRHILQRLENYADNLTKTRDKNFRLDPRLNQFSILINKGE